MIRPANVQEERLRQRGARQRRARAFMEVDVPWSMARQGRRARTLRYKKRPGQVRAAGNSYLAGAALGLLFLQLGNLRKHLTLALGHDLAVLAEELIVWHPLRHVILKATRR